MSQYTGVSAVERSENSKIGTVSATYVSQRSCPKDCALYHAGCHAESGNVGFQTARLNKDAARSRRNVLQLAREEARAIRGLSGQLPLRLHVVGDSTTDRAASTVAAAARDYSARFGQRVWTYTHAWRQVRRRAWQGVVSVLASCETTKDVRQAKRKGYATALIVREFRQQTAYVEDGVKLVPCPQQTGRAASCERCRLCWNADRLRLIGATIAFVVHGSEAHKAAERLVQIQAAAAHG